MEKGLQLYEGKAKKVFATKDPQLLIVSYKDDATAFNGQKRGTIAGKGVINNKMSNVLMQMLESQGVPTHFVRQLSDRDTLVKKVTIIPLEVVIRNISAGSFANHYGVKEGIPFEEPTIEFSYKNDELGDPLINESQALALHLASPEELETIKGYALHVNEVLKEFWSSCGVTLVDFKLEFGRLDDGKIILADEISPDTCRLWDSKTGEKLDKDRFRRDLGGVEDAYREIMSRLEKNLKMKNCVIVGINWGDEGKGRMVDLLTDHYDVVVRYQGGGNAGHTVVNDKGKFALHLLPSGIFREGVVNVLGNGVALDPENLVKEIREVREKGVEITPDNLKISDRASLLFPWHRDLDALEESRLADKQFGSTKQGIAPFYSDKSEKKTVLAGELLYPDELKAHLRDLLEWEDLTLTKIYGAKAYTMEMLEEWIEEYCRPILPYICDTGSFLQTAHNSGKGILFEAQLGALRDLDFGIHPYTTSSNTLAAYAPIGSGFPGATIDEVIGVVKAYSTCVGEGPFVCEWFGEEADRLREAGFEYGAKTGRPRRVGPIDLVATRYGAEMQAATEIALTKLDVLSYLDRIPVCTRYLVQGKEVDRFPFPTLLEQAKPVYEYLDGWKCDISDVRRWEDLPEQAREYVTYLERAIGRPITYVSVGPERDSIIVRSADGK